MEKNTKILIGIIVFLILLNLTILGVVSYKKNENTLYKVQDKKEMVIPTRHLGRFFRDQLNLSTKQHRAFQVIRQDYHKNSDIILEKMTKNRHTIITELGKNKSDTLMLKSLSTELGSLHTALKNRTIQYYLDMKDVCTEEQKVKLFQTFKAMVDADLTVTMPEEKNYKNN